jgi:hypothetical protein
MVELEELRVLVERAGKSVRQEQADGIREDGNCVTHDGAVNVAYAVPVVVARSF